MSKTIISLAFTESVIGVRKRSLYRTVFRLCIVNDAHKQAFSVCMPVTLVLWELLLFECTMLH